MVKENHMSAFYVSHDHINAILTYIRENRIRYWHDPSKVMDYNDENLTKAGQWLLHTNRKSLKTSYGEKHSKIIGEGKEPEKYTFSADARMKEMIDKNKNEAHLRFFKMIECLDHQCCELPEMEYEFSAFRLFVLRMKEYACGELIISELRNKPGHDQWEWTREKPSQTRSGTAESTSNPSLIEEELLAS